MPRFAVCAFVDQVEPGSEHPRGQLPLHVTLLGPFSTTAELEQIVGVVGGAIAGMAPIGIRVGDDELFGPNRDIEVSLLDDDAEVTDAHRLILDASRFIRARLDSPEYAGDGFRAHVTVLPDDRLERGEVHELDEIAIVEFGPEARRDIRRIGALIRLI